MPKRIHGHLEVRIQTLINVLALQQQQHTSSTGSLSLCSQSSQHQTHRWAQQSTTFTHSHQ